MSAIDLKTQVFAVDTKPTICCTVRDLLKDPDIKNYVSKQLHEKLNECLGGLKVEVMGVSYPIRTYLFTERVELMIENFITSASDMNECEFYLSGKYLNKDNKVPFMGTDIEGEILMILSFKITVQRKIYGMINGTRFEIDLIRQSGLDNPYGFLSAPKSVLRKLGLSANTVDDIKLTLVKEE